MKISIYLISTLLLVFLLNGLVYSQKTGSVDCSTVRCAMPTCGPHEVAVKADNECCYHCSRKPCENIMCPLYIKYCQEGEVPSGCCPCTPNPCDGIMCPLYIRYCEAGETPTGCCPCTPNPCEGIMCPLYIRYCEAGEEPTGCCPCTPRETL